MSAKRKYRVVPADKAWYTGDTFAGLHVVQYHDPEVGRWFDVGDPKSYDDAVAARQERERVERMETDDSMTVAQAGIPTTCSHCGAELVNEDCPNYGYGVEHA